MTTANAQEIFISAAKELNAGNIDAGEKLLNQSLALNPNNAAALDLAARLAFTKGDLDAAESYGRRAIAQQASVAFVLTLADVLRSQHKLQEAANFYTKILEKVPNEVRALSGLGEICDEAGQRDQAIKYYEATLAIQPKDMNIAVKLSNLLSGDDLPGGLTVLERAKPEQSVAAKFRIGFLNHLTLYKEWAERFKRGLAPFHSAKLADSFFTFAAAERDEYESLADQLLAENPAHKHALSAKAASLFSRGKRIEAEPYFKKVAEFNKGVVYENIAFQPEFFKRIEAMTTAEMAAGLPPLVDVQSASFTDAPIIYLSCNYDYFANFARAMVLSIDDVTPQPQLHLHIMDATAADLEAAKAFCAKLKKAVVAISTEQTGVDPADQMARRCYYHSIRFIRLLQHLEQYKKPLWLMDVDAVLNRDPQPMFDSMNGADVAFRARPGRWEPWNQFNASVIGLQPTEKGIAYLRLVSAYVVDFYRRGNLRWGIDQLAMYAVHEYLKDEGRAPEVFLLDERAVDYSYQDDGFVWCSSGRGKFIQLKQIEKGKTTGVDSKTAKYFEAFRKYTSQIS